MPPKILASHNQHSLAICLVGSRQTYFQLRAAFLSLALCKRLLRHCQVNVQSYIVQSCNFSVPCALMFVVIQPYWLPNPIKVIIEFQHFVKENSAMTIQACDRRTDRQNCYINIVRQCADAIKTMSVSCSYVPIDFTPFVLCYHG